MEIAICGSMSFANEMLEARSKLEELGHRCLLPDGTEEYATVGPAVYGGLEGAERKIAYDLIRAHYRKIQAVDAIVVVNCDKNDITNYIGGNTFLEIGFAYILSKPIFLLNDIPELEIIKQEIVAMRPTILHGDYTEVNKVYGAGGGS